MDKHLVL